MKDVRVEIKFRNNYLYRAIYDSYKSISEFCRLTNLSADTVYCYLRFSLSPISTRSPLDDDGKVVLNSVIFKQSAVKISSVLDLSPLYLWPEHLWYVKGKNYTAEIDIPIQLIPYNENLTITDSREYDIFDYDEIPKVLASLTPREEGVIRKSFGLGCPQQTKAAIADELGVSRTRVGQIEAKAIRKMRHPELSYKLKQES